MSGGALFFMVKVGDNVPYLGTSVGERRILESGIRVGG